MSHEHSDDHDHDHDETELTIDAQTQLFLEMRRQNVELLQLACRFAGYGGDHGPIKPDEVEKALLRLWEIYSEFYEWIDPEKSVEED